MNHRQNDPYDEHLREGVERLSQVGLSDAARSRIRGSIASFARENPAVGATPRRFNFPGVESPWASELLSMEAVTRPALASVLVALLVGSTISYAAEVALPGDPLYWVKTEVSETVADVLTVSSVAQVEWDARKVERRLEEALALAAGDRLDESARNQVEAGLERGIAEFSEHVGAVLNEDPVLASAVRAELEVTLRAHEEVFGDLGQDEGEESTAIAAIADRTRALADAVAADRAALDAALAKETLFLKGVASSKANDASLEVASARRALTRVHGRSDVGSAAEAEMSAKLALSADSYAAGDAAAESGNYAEAFSDYQDSHRFAKEARLLTLVSGRSNGNGNGKDGDDSKDGDEGKDEGEKDKDADDGSDEETSPEKGAGEDRDDAADAKNSGESEVRVDVKVDAAAETKAGVGNLNLL